MCSPPPHSPPRWNPVMHSPQQTSCCSSCHPSHCTSYDAETVANDTKNEASRTPGKRPARACCGHLTAHSFGGRAHELTRPLTISYPLTNVGIRGCEPLLELRNAGCHTCPRPRINPVWHHRSCLHGLSRSPCTRIFIRCNVDSAQPQTPKLLYCPPLPLPSAIRPPRRPPGLSPWCPPFPPPKMCVRHSGTSFPRWIRSSLWMTDPVLTPTNSLQRSPRSVSRCFVLPKTVESPRPSTPE